MSEDTQEQNQDQKTEQTSQSQWWHADLNHLASQLSRGMLNDMKRRILTSNIKKEKLTLNENGERIKEFFEREISRYQRRQASLTAKKREIAQSQHTTKRLQTKLRYKEQECEQYKKIIEGQMKMLHSFKAKLLAQNQAPRKASP